MGKGKHFRKISMRVAFSFNSGVWCAVMWRDFGLWLKRVWLYSPFLQIFPHLLGMHLLYFIRVLEPSLLVLWFPTLFGLGKIFLSIHHSHTRCVFYSICFRFCSAPNGVEDEGVFSGSSRWWRMGFWSRIGEVAWAVSETLRIGQGSAMASATMDVLCSLESFSIPGCTGSSYKML